jgi:isopentenyl phosphate kinase
MHTEGKNTLFSKVLHLFDWSAIDLRASMAGDIIILKFGGSLITDKKSETPKADHNALGKISNILKDKNRKLIIVHGAGSYGHPIAKKYKIAEGLNDSQEQKEAIEETRNQVYELNQLLCKSLQEAGIRTESVIPSHSMQTKGARKIENFPVDEFERALKKGKVPVTFGDVTEDLVQGINILSGDVIMMELARIYKPSLAVFVMDYPGVMEDPGSENSKIIPLVNSETRGSIGKYYGKGDLMDVTGGLVGKLECAAEIAKHSQCWITSLDNLDNCLNGDLQGSRVVP